jgi:hypothetical protein
MRSVEPLESRIAPAVLVAAGGHSATYTDVDGDKVTVAVSTGTLTAGLFTTAASGVGEQLRLIDLSGGGFDGANLTFSSAKAPGGDGLVNVGYVNSLGHDLGKVSVKGDLGRIDAGTDSAGTPAIKSLTTRSLGRLFLDTQAPGDSLQSNIKGALGSLAVAGDVKDAFISVTGSNGKIGSITIGGSLVGGLLDNSGEIRSSRDMGPIKIGHHVQGGFGASSGLIESLGELASVSIGGSILGGSNGASGQVYSSGAMGPVKVGHDVRGGSAAGSGDIFTSSTLAGVSVGGSLVGGSGATGTIHSGGDMGSVKIGHDVQGGPGDASGRIESYGKLAGVTVGGSLVGGSNTDSGQVVSSGDMGAVKVGHDVQGGSGVDSGVILSYASLAGVNIGGSLIGGTNTFSGIIDSFGDLGAVKIGHDLTGGSVSGGAALDSSGLIESNHRISSVAIGGSIVSGIDSSGGGKLTRNASVRAGNDIGSLTVSGSLVGNFTSPVVISARGQAVQGATTDRAIGKIAIGGRVEFANILAGYDTYLTALNGDAQIGSVSVGGDWVASNLVAGATNLGADEAAGGSGFNADNLNFGDAHDASIAPGSAGIVASIASVTIKGQAFGTPGTLHNLDHYAFVAERIGSLKIGGHAVALAAGPHDDNLNVGETSDLTVHEV